ncbi:MAG: protoheme IX farnesyltransferase [marine bacterium B5-7]|nr:MAG: protoheme IX farnesyltransferase [marine bacterium B5-7]
MKQLISDYLELTKPKVVLLMLLTSLVGMCMASEYGLHLSAVLLGTIGIAFGAGGAAVLNHVADQHLDKLMRRTENRPVATGKVSTVQSLLFAGVLIALSMWILFQWVNAVTAILTFFSLIVYAVIYTLYLKHTTPQNIVIGGIAGAIPPLLGWTAIAGGIDPHALLLVLIIFVWTPPHFWALAIHRYEDYKSAKVPMLPNTHGIPYTKLHILLYTLLLVAVTILPYSTGMSGTLYFAGVMLLNARFLYWVIKLYRFSEPNTAIKTFRYSITYLGLLFLLLLLDHITGGGIR